MGASYLKMRGWQRGDVPDFAIGKPDFAQALAIFLLDPVGLRGELHGKVEHRPIAERAPCGAIVHQASAG
jgi:hypothetical protein